MGKIKFFLLIFPTPSFHKSLLVLLACTLTFFRKLFALIHWFHKSEIAVHNVSSGYLVRTRKIAASITEAFVDSKSFLLLVDGILLNHLLRCVEEVG